MLSRVADSLYWMSRYFERADHCARVLDANYNLMLNPSKISTEQRWQRITTSLGLEAQPSMTPDPQADIVRLLSDAENRGSIVACVTSARENASQIREQISSEMWERLNQLYHEVSRMQFGRDPDAHPLRLVTTVREGWYKFQGVTDATMSHDEGWHFIQFGRFMERTCTISMLVDAYFGESLETDDLDWVALLSSCLAFEGYCKVYTADLRPDSVAEFLLLNAEFPYTVRHSVDAMRLALQGIAQASPARKSNRIDRIVGQLRASLAYTQIEEIMSNDLHSYLCTIIERCREVHAAIHQLYIDYPIASTLGA
jgi:uncharacterized alpha-E superfamily protein